MTLLSLQALTVRRGECPVVDRVSFEVREGEVVGLLGPNGAGKTTLMRGALGLIEATGRSSLAELPAKARAKAAAWLPQAREIAWPMPVEAVVRLGRLPHGDDGSAAVEQALERMDLGAMRHRPATELSGGEQARVLIARTLAQEAPLVLADEPVAGLDPAHQIATMQIFEELAREGRAVIVSLHDLGLAVRHCTRLILMQSGQVVADGAPLEVLTPTRLREVFHISAHISESDSGPIFQPLEVIR
jgi:iron complex transport system ATP-binding protein